jgi:hypothetical protein
MAVRLSPFDPALLSLPNNQLGLYAYAWWVFAQAEKFGISQDQLTPEIAERLRIKLLRLDTNSEDPASLEKALQGDGSG